MYVIGMPFFYIFVELDDAPSVMFFCLGPAFASMVIAVVVAVLKDFYKKRLK